MECLSVSKLPEGSRWLWEIKLDGYRALAVKSGDDSILPASVAVRRIDG
jgi:ATP-dependent DNA ligase